MPHRPTWMLLGILPCAILGCGGDDGRPPLFPTTGSVQVDGKPAPGVQLRFYPAEKVDDPDTLKPAAVTDAEGRFTLGTYGNDDGAPEGRYKVTLYLPAEPPNGSNSPPDLLGTRYLNPGKSPVEAKVGPSPNALEPFRVEASKAAPRPRPRMTRPDSDGVN